MRQGRCITLNLGLGRDSFCMLCLLLEGRLIAQGQPLALPDITAVVTSDTGEEWDFTYANLPLVQELCRQAGLRFLHLRKPAAEGDKGWQAWLDAKASAKARGEWLEPFWRDDAPASIEARAASGYYHLRPPIMDDYGSRCTTISLKRQDCTSNHKIGPIRRLLEDLAHAIFGVESNAAWGRDVRRGVRKPHLTLIGYAADENHRFEDVPEGAWYVEEAYPLVELGVSKAAEEPILARWHLSHVRKSGCVMCPFQPVGWYWALKHVDPETYARVFAYEQRSVASNPRMTVLPGGTPLEEAITRWRAKNPDATIDDVLNKRYERCKTKHLPGESIAALPTLNSQLVMPLDGEACASDPLLLSTMARVLLRSLGPASAPAETLPTDGW